MSGVDPTTVLLAAAFIAVYGFAVVRSTRCWSFRWRWLARCLLFAWACIAPPIFFFVNGYLNSTCQNFALLCIEAFVTCLMFYGLMIMIADPPVLYLEEPLKRRGVRLAAIGCSVPSWGCSICFLYYWMNLEYWEPLGPFEFVYCVAGIAFGLLSITLMLFSMSEYETMPSDVGWTLWAVFPVVLTIFLLAFDYLKGVFVS